MFKILTLILCLSALTVQAHVQPAEGSKLNYLLAGFVADNAAHTAGYRLQIATGNYTDEGQFGRHIIIDTVLAENRSITELPAFGTQYTWQVSYINNKHKTTGKSKLYHFATDSLESVDTSKYRLKVITNTYSNSDMLVATDFRGVLYNLQGKPMWFLPKINTLSNNPFQLRDLKPTSYGTFTCLYGSNAIEVDYNGKLLWKAPNNGKISGDTSEFYHHEFTRLDNGHYMICGDELWWAKPDSVQYGKIYMPSNIEAEARKGHVYRRYIFGTIIEYDAKGNIIWHWKSRTHFLKNEPVPLVSKPAYTGFTHLNSFFLDEKDSSLYLSFRDINRVVKIRYPSGEWLNSYGDKYANDSIETTCDYFCGQHCARTTPGGEFYLFDNHNKRGDRNTLSYISIYREPQGNNKELNLTQTWSFACNIDSNASGGTSTGGGVYMLPDSAILCTMGAAGRLFIVNRDKKILWNAISQQNIRPGNPKSWRNVSEYRVYPIVNKADLARFIFH